MPVRYYAYHRVYDIAFLNNKLLYFMGIVFNF